MFGFEYYTPTKVVFGKNTEEKAGALIREFGGSRVLIHYGGQSAVKSGLIDRINNELGRPVTVIGTGGIAALIVPSCRHKIHYDKDLLLKGLWYLYQKNCRQK